MKKATGWLWKCEVKEYLSWDRVYGETVLDTPSEDRIMKYKKEFLGTSDGGKCPACGKCKPTKVSIELKEVE